ncbi:binding partner of ACD11 1-like isoform X1 [Aristolochia californica]|uniref:binding partner of ACD11 1-like isoform X1 n=2 Tax=Aristolochia californica TaxID=171875 RepID=UPI0035DF3152
MSVLKDQVDQRMESESPLTVTPNWTITVSDIRTVKVSNISQSAIEQDIWEFFSFSGDIRYIEMQSESEMSQLAYVTFKESQGADTAILLSGATIVDRSVNISPVENYELPPSAFASERRYPAAAESLMVKKAEDTVSTMLAKGFILGKGAINMAKSFDERHKLTSNASATVTSLDRKVGLSDKLSTGTAMVNEKLREVDERYQLFEKTKSALVAAEQKASSAGSVLTSNRYISTGSSWISSAFNMMAKAAEDVTTLTKEKLEKAEEEKKESIYLMRTGIVNDFAQIHLDDEPLMVVAQEHAPTIPVDSQEEGGLGII